MEYRGVTDESLKSRQFRKALNPSLVDFIERIQSYDYIPEITKVSEDTGLHASTIWRYMNDLREKGFKFTIDIDILRLGLEAVALIIDKYVEYEKVFKSVLRFYAPLLPWGTFLIYLTPREMSEALVNNLARVLPSEPKEIIKLTYTIPVKPDIKRYYDPTTNSIRLDWSELLTTIKSAPRETVPSRVPKKGRFDEVDLLIIRELEKDPFTPLKKITESINEVLKSVVPVNYIRVLRHFKNHIELRDIIRGVKLIPTPLRIHANTYVAVELRGNPAELHRVGKVLGAHPFFDQALLNPTEGVGLLLGSLPAEEVFNFSIFLEELRKSRIVKEWRYYILDKTRKKMLTMPHTVLTESINDLVEYFIHHGKDEVVSDVLDI